MIPMIDTGVFTPAVILYSVMIIFVTDSGIRCSISDPTDRANVAERKAVAKGEEYLPPPSAF